MSTQSPRSPQAGKSAVPAGRAVMPGKPQGKGSWTTRPLDVAADRARLRGAGDRSYFTYYVIKPAGGTTSYGALVEPQRPIPEQLVVTDENGKPMTRSRCAANGCWSSWMAAPATTACVDASLYFMRQVRATQGPERERVVEVWLRTDRQTCPDVIQKAYPEHGQADRRSRPTLAALAAGRCRHDATHRSHLSGRS